MSDRPGKSDGPVLIELGEDAVGLSPADAPPVEMPESLPEGQAMQAVTTLATRRVSWLGRWFWRLLLTVVVFFVSVAAWDLLSGLLARSPILGGVATGLVALFLLVCLAILFRELAALARLRKVEKLQSRAAAISTSGELADAKAFADELGAFYAGREDLRWSKERFREGVSEAFDVETVMLLADDVMLSPLDVRASREIEAAARQVATVTALVPLAFADILAALVTNLRMIRRIAELYGGRSGTLGAWRLTRAVIAHLVATGAVAVGDDLLGSVGGGHLLSKISRRFGEGLVNGALTARVGVAAMEVCRPLPFAEGRRPKVTGLVRRALTGLFESARSDKI